MDIEKFQRKRKWSISKAARSDRLKCCQLSWMHTPKGKGGLIAAKLLVVMCLSLAASLYMVQKHHSMNVNRLSRSNGRKIGPGGKGSPDEPYKFVSLMSPFLKNSNTSCPVAWEYTEDSEQADVIWHSSIGSARSSREKYPDKKLAFYSLESSTNYPDIVKMKSNYGFDYSVDYRIWPGHPAGLADIPAVYLANPSVPEFTIDFRRSPHFPKRNDAVMAAFISHCHAPNGRDKILDALMKAFPVHSYGRCRRNMELGGKTRDWQADKVRIASQYYFIFTPENSNEFGYVTEKVYDGLQAGALPIYFGAPDIKRFIPDPSAIIDVADFASIDDLIKYLNHLLEDEQAYLKHFEWKKKEFSSDFKRVLRLASRTVECRLAMHLSGQDFEEDLRDLDLFPVFP